MKSFNPFKLPSGIEIDLRKELNSFMFGAADEIAKGAFYVLRQMRRRDGVVYPRAEGDLYPCSCKGSPENEPDIDYRCEICDGEGYLFDDRIVVGYKRSQDEDVEKYKKWGKQTTPLSFFYVECHELISRYDKIIEPVVDIDGRVSTPIKIMLRHNIHMAERFRSDGGRTEYWRLSVFGE